MDLNKTGHLISTLRKEKGLTQKELGDKLGITDRAVSKWERGLGCPDISLLDDLSKELDVSILEILKGRLLDKDEIASNEVLIESMNYSKESFKNRIKKRFNKIAITIIVLICIFFCFINIKSFYYLNKTYKVNEIDEYSYYKTNKLKSNIELIKNNKGKFNEEEYSLILDYLKADDLLNGIDKYLTKDSYTYNEIYLSYKELLKYYKIIPKSEIIYKMLIKYDYNVIDNIKNYYAYNDIYSSSLEGIIKLLDSPYHISGNNLSFYIENINQAVEFRIELTEELIKTIIEVGDINE